jgi:mRNA interferase RelE/StbE
MTSKKSKTWIIEYAHSAYEEITALDGAVKKLIKKAIEDKLMVDPLKFGSPLRRNLAGLFKLRVGNYRIIYQIKNNEVIVLIVAIGHRSRVYKD